MKTALHHWDIAPREAIALQKKLARKVKLERLKKDVRSIVGADMAIAGNEGIACIVVFSLPELTEVERIIVRRGLKFPYISGLLSFREAPLLLEAFEGLKHTPDAAMFDGQGIAHPRRLGLASHMGLWLDIPTIGCAKSILCGEYKEPSKKAGGVTDIKDGEKKIGVCLRSRDSVRPIYISPGHLIDFEDSVRLVKACLDGFRIPKPTRIADRLAGREARGLSFTSIMISIGSKIIPVFQTWGEK